MAKYSLDDILNELGVEGAAKKHAPATQDGSDAVPMNARKPRALDKQTDLGGVPAAPAHQGHQQTSPPAANAPSRDSGEFYRPESNENGEGTLETDLATLVLKQGAPADKVAQAQTIVKQSPNVRLADALVEQGVDESLVQSMVAMIAGVPFERINLDKGLDGGFDGKMLQRLTGEFCKTHYVLPLRMEGQRAVVGAVKPDSVFLLDDVKIRLGVMSVKLVLVTAYDIRGALEIIGEGTSQAQEDIGSLLGDVEEGDVQVEKKQTEETDLEKAAGLNPVIRIVNHIIQLAVKEGASDIHIEPAEKKLRVRYRIDGELAELFTPPASMSAAITSRLKIMANMDISERRLPQDGRIRCVVGGRKLDLRVSTLPCGYGEKTVMRILDSRSISVELSQLGFHEDAYTIWKKVVDAPHGINLVTGPTGSGKTTTLYASLRTLDKSSMNICTVEDPIEYHLEGITQSQMHEKIGMTFAAALRALLRQDPDVIMLGEIRDMETAMIAVQAALTGHLVLSTLHTNDAPSSITRLVNIGLEPFLVGAAVNAVLAQRLIRKLCTVCKAEEDPPENLKEFLESNGMNMNKVWVPKGCDRCRKCGYSGRVGIYELLPVDDQLRDIIARNPNVAEFRRMCIERGMVTLRQDGMRKVQAGITTVSEVLRATDGH